MEVQTCAFESPTITNSNYYYGKINIGSVIMCFLIIYSTAISIVLSVKQLIQVIKEEELIQEMEEEEEEVVKTQVNKEEEEVIVKEVVKVDVQTQVDKEEEEKERKKKEQKREQKEEEELLLANYNAKERTLALQAAYDERAKLAFEKWQTAYRNLFTIQKDKFDKMQSGYCNNSDYLSLVTNVQEEYLETNEKSTRYEAFNALKKARLIDLNCNSYTEYAHLFNS
jgi:vacuolar-type H+-ATPase subunit I/STV1